MSNLDVFDPLEKKTAIELQKAAKKHFPDTVKIENNCSLVNMLLNKYHPPLPDNFKLYLRRLNKIANYKKTQQFYELYENNK